MLGRLRLLALRLPHGPIVKCALWSAPTRSGRPPLASPAPSPGVDPALLRVARMEVALIVDPADGVSVGPFDLPAGALDEPDGDGSVVVVGAVPELDAGGDA